MGQVATKENVGAQFRQPRTSGANLAFLTVARGMLEKATAQNELLVGRGMSEKLLGDLTAGITEFEQTLEVTRASRRDHVGASADLTAVFSEISEQMRLSDGLVRYRFGDNEELMGTWASARSVFGPPKSHEEPDAGGETPGGGEAGGVGPHPQTYAARRGRWMVTCRASCCVKAFLGCARERN